MKKTSLVISAALLMFTGMVNAHGPVRGKMTATITIEAPAAKVWEVIKDYGDMSWHPSIKSVKGGGNEKGAVRTLTLANGGTITEELKSHDDGKMAYKYKITEMSSSGSIKHAGQDEEIPVLPVGNYAAELSVADKGGKAEVEWVATYYRAYVNNNPPAELNEEAADKAVTAVLSTGLEALAKKLAPSGKAEVSIDLKR
ncbi:SRPBCC family protein [Methylomonas sp. SURF-2]|uniref:SRPBCC family protein n=1 Tax=Methylomonas subterranea TaxID=2952225 RepID=A0ABT1TEQ1_9GAMM|nr:SRPBCC family protein [Methylomonas sp. SURF-2]MCQ8103905.1 SRPBCC family protein [Methylomonas sp. SURF-2]